MSVRTDTVNLIVNINGNQSQNQLNELRKKAADIKFEMEGLKKGTQAYIDKNKELRQVTADMAALKKEIGITSLTQKELTSELSKLKSLRGSVVPFTKEYKDLSNQIKQVENRLYDVRNGVQGFASSFSKVKDEIKQFGVLAAGYLGFQFITQQFTNILRGAGKLSDSLADIQRVTGLTDTEVKSLNKSLSALDTRTTTAGLREITLIAGKLGVAKEDLLGFTQAVDHLVVALGDELGGADEITTQLGKILNVFEGKITSEGITHLGNAIVDLANKGVATGGFLVDFTQRLSGIAKTSNFSLESILGLGAGLEENGARVESAATAISKLINTIALDLPKAAKIAGQDLDTFSAHFAKDPQIALLDYAAGLQKNKESFAEIATSFKDAGEEGARVVSTLATLGVKTDFFRQKISDTGVALQNTNAINNAFELKNQTLGATMDKLGKDFTRFFNSPAVTGFLKGAVEGISNFIKFLKDLPDFLERNRTVLIALTGVVLTYAAAKTKAAQASILKRAVLLLEIAVDKIHLVLLYAQAIAINAYSYAKDVLTGKIKLATVAQTIWNNVIKANPIAALIALITAAATAFSYFTNRVTAAGEAQKTANEIQRRAAVSTAEQEGALRTLISVYTDLRLPEEVRKKALQDIIALNPQYLSGLNKNNLSLSEGITILNNYVGALRQKAAAEAATDIQKDLLKKDTELKLALTYGKSKGLPDSWLSDLQDQRNVIAEQLKVTEDVIKQNYVKQNAAVIRGSGNVVKEAVATTIKSIKDQIKSLDDAYETIDVSNKKALISNRDHRKQLQDELDKIENKPTKQSAAEKQFVRVEKEADKLRKLWKDLQNEINDSFALMQNDPFAEALHKANEAAEKETEKLDLLFKKRIISQQEYADATAKIEQIRLQKLKDAVAKYVPANDPQRNPFAPGTIDPLGDKFKGAGARITSDALSAAELQALYARGKARLKAELDILKIKEAQELSNTELTENEIAKIQAEYRERAKQATTEHFAAIAFAILDTAQQLQQIGTTVSNVLTNIENKQLAREKRINDEKLANYKKLHDNKLISDKKYNDLVAKQDAEMAKKKHDADVKSFKRQQKLAIIGAIINGAMAITSTLSARPGLADIFSLGIARAIQVGLVVAATGAQVAEIASQSPPEAGDGGYFTGPSHKDGGIPVIIEGDEAVTNKRTMRDTNTYTVTGTPSQITSKLNSMHGGVNWAGGATISDTPRWRTQTPSYVSSSMPRIMAQGGYAGNASSSAAGNSNLETLVSNLIDEHRETRKEIANFNRELHAKVSIKEYRLEEKKYDAAQKAGGINT